MPSRFGSRRQPGPGRARTWMRAEHAIWIPAVRMSAPITLYSSLPVQENHAFEEAERVCTTKKRSLTALVGVFLAQVWNRERFFFSNWRRPLL